MKEMDTETKKRIIQRWSEMVISSRPAPTTGLLYKCKLYWGYHISITDECESYDEVISKAYNIVNSVAFVEVCKILKKSPGKYSTTQVRNLMYSQILHSFHSKPLK